MGTWLSCGIATQIAIEKEWYTKEKIINDIKNEIDLNIYNISENDKYLFLSIKEDVFEKNAVAFIKEQLQPLIESNRLDEKYIKQLETLKGKSYEELIKIADEKSVHLFQLIEGCRVSNIVSYLTKNKFAVADMIIFLSDGKCMMESYRDTFYYLRKSVINTSNNPIKTSFVISIIG